MVPLLTALAGLALGAAVMYVVRGSIAAQNAQSAESRARRVVLDAEREAEFGLTAEDVAELDRRWADHVRRPESAIPWDEVRRKLLDRE